MLKEPPGAILFTTPPGTLQHLSSRNWGHIKLRYPRQEDAGTARDNRDCGIPGLRRSSLRHLLHVAMNAALPALIAFRSYTKIGVDFFGIFRWGL